jgi:hypothetical protein
MLARCPPELFNFTDVTSNAVRGCATSAIAPASSSPISTYLVFDIGAIIAPAREGVMP